MQVVLLLLAALFVSVLTNVFISHELIELHRRVEREADWIDREACIVEELDYEP